MRKSFTPELWANQKQSAELIDITSPSGEEKETWALLFREFSQEISANSPGLDSQTISKIVFFTWAKFFFNNQFLHHHSRKKNSERTTAFTQQPATLWQSVFSNSLPAVLLKNDYSWYLPSPELVAKIPATFFFPEQKRSFWQFFCQKMNVTTPHPEGTLLSCTYRFLLDFQKTHNPSSQLALSFNQREEEFASFWGHTARELTSYPLVRDHDFLGPFYNLLYFDFSQTPSPEQQIPCLQLKSAEYSYSFLYQQITQTLGQGSEDGGLWLFTSKNILIDACHKKFKTLSEHYQLDWFIQLSFKFCRKVYYLYLFKKKVPAQNTYKRLDLDFYHQQSITPHAYKKWFKNLKAMIHGEKNYSSKTTEDYSFHFFHASQEALLYHTKHHQNMVIHPQLFKQIVRSCLPLDQFIEFNISTDKLSSSLFPAESLPQQKGYLLYQDINTLSLYDKPPKRGNALPIFFKEQTQLLTIFNDFYDSPLGKHILQMSVAYAHGSVKNKIKKVLFPKKILTLSSESQKLPLKLSLELSDDLQRELSQELIKAKESEEVASQLYLFSHLKQKLLALQEKIDACWDGDTSEKKLNFDAEWVLQNLIAGENHSLEEASFLRVEKTTLFQAQRPYTHHECRVDHQNLHTHQLTLYHHEEILCHIYGPQTVITFLTMLLENTRPQCLKDFISKSRVPSPENFQNTRHLLEKYRSFAHNCLHEVRTEIAQLFYDMVFYD